MSNANQEKRKRRSYTKRMKREILKKFKNQKLSERKFCAENNI